MALAVLLRYVGFIPIAIALAQFPAYSLLVVRLRYSQKAMLMLAGAHAVVAIVACSLVLHSETFS